MDDVHFNFEDLKVYPEAYDFTDYAYDLVEKFPFREINGLRGWFIRGVL